MVSKNMTLLGLVGFPRSNLQSRVPTVLEKSIFGHAPKLCWPMAKLLKSRPNVLEEPFANIAFQYFLPAPHRSIHELLVYLPCFS